MSNQSPATKAALRALDTLQRVGKRLQDDYRLPLGTEEVSEREITNLMQAAKGGDMYAGAQLVKMAREAGHVGDLGQDDGCAICQRANQFMAKESSDVT